MNKKIFDNIVIPVSNYATYGLQEVLSQYGGQGYQLVNVTMAENRNDVMIMYCFFTKEIE